MIRCSKCGKTTKPRESTALLYEYRADGSIAGQKRVCLNCSKKDKKD